MALAVQATLSSAANSVGVDTTGLGDPNDVEPTSEPWFFAAVALFLLVSAVAQVVRWWSFTFHIGATHLVVDEGVLTRHHRVVPYDKVQQVDLQRPFVAQLLGLSAVRIDTAGAGGAASITLRYLDRRHADAVRHEVLLRRDVASAPSPAPTLRPPSGLASSTGAAPPAPIAEPQVLQRIGGTRLLLATVTSDGFVLTLVVVVFATAWLLVLGATSDDATAALSVVGTSWFAIGWITAFTITGQLLARWNLIVTLQGDDLHATSGLTDIKQVTIPRRRVQYVRILDNPLRRLLGYVSVSVHSAAANDATGNDAAVPNRFDLPLVARRDLDHVLRAVLGPVTWSHPTTPRDGRARRRAVVRRTLLLTLPAVIPAVALFPAGLLLLAFGGLGVPWGLDAHRLAGWARTSEVASFASGSLRHEVVLVPLPRVQGVRREASVFQRRAGLTTLRLDVAGDQRSVNANGPGLYDLDEAVSAAMVAPLSGTPWRALFDQPARSAGGQAGSS